MLHAPPPHTNENLRRDGTSLSRLLSLGLAARRATARCNRVLLLLLLARVSSGKWERLKGFYARDNDANSADLDLRGWSARLRGGNVLLVAA